MNAAGAAVRNWIGASDFDSRILDRHSKPRGAIEGSPATLVFSVFWVWNVNFSLVAEKNVISAGGQTPSVATGFVAPHTICNATLNALFPPLSLGNERDFR